MSYYTSVSLDWHSEESNSEHSPEFSFELLKPIAEKWCDEMGCAFERGVGDDLKELLARGSCYGFNGMYAGLIIDLFCTISANFPNIRFIVRGNGEEYTDFWLRVLLNGEKLFGSGPFEIDENNNWS